MWIPRAVIALLGVIVLSWGFLVRKRLPRQESNRYMEGVVTSLRKEYLSHPDTRAIQEYQLPVVQYRVEQKDSENTPVFNVGDTVRTPLEKTTTGPSSIRHLWLWGIGVVLVILALLI